MKEHVMEYERRDASVAWPEQDMEVRAVGDGMEFAGYAAVFDSPSEDLGGFREVIKPGAFTRSINAAKNGSADIRMFWNHDAGRPLGSTRANLRLSEDSVGLVAEAKMPDTVDGRDMALLVREKIVRSMSFGFTVPTKTSDGRDAQERPSKDNGMVRTIHTVTLFEVSPVTSWPAYKATAASVRHILTAIDWDDEDSVRVASEMFTPEQREVWLRYLNRTSPNPLVSPWVAERLALLEAKKRAA
jgi:uncharacterized protein